MSEVYLVLEIILVLMTKITKLITLKTRESRALRMAGIFAAGILTLPLVLMNVPIQQASANNCFGGTDRCYAVTTFDYNAGATRAAKAKFKTFTMTTGSGSLINNHLWVHLGAGDWLEVGYIKTGLNNQRGDWAIYLDGANVGAGQFTALVPNWYWYEIEDKDNNGIWKIYYGSTSPSNFLAQYNFAIYSGSTQAGIETNDTTSSTTAEADMDQLHFYWIFYQLWPSGNAVPHDPPYKIKECTQYHVKVKKNVMPTC